MLGTTITPCLFFWQASQEVEEEKAMGRRLLVQRERATKRELDVGTANFYPNAVMYFIILTTALALHAHGKPDMETSQQAAEALRPLAGKLAAMLYTLGLLASARYFYGVLITSTLIGIRMDFAGVNPMKALYWSAVINGVLAPFLLIGILIVASSHALMQHEPSSWLSRIIVGATCFIMFAASATMLFL